ncbi:hypothetical protein [Marinibacterium sp. SX1]|uniref:tetratricopeptide repeat protein n=1 Tax=Marinibacterium sp. SX1 TaxID=3388424 RepID=UPI003D183D90
MIRPLFRRPATSRPLVRPATAPRPVAALLLATALVLPGMTVPLGPATAQTAPAEARPLPLPLAFLPPDMAPQDLCNRTSTPTGQTDLTTEGGEEELTDAQRIRFLSGDILTYQRRDAVLYFDFINALITRKAQLDPGFAGVEETLARINLYQRAERFDALAASGLVAGLERNREALANNHLVRLAQYYRMGLGVPRNEALAQEMIRDAAYGGHAGALLEIASMQARGRMVDGWAAPLDLTVTMAFGGMLGEMTPSVCRRAERIAEEYLKGELVAFNPEIALAWRRFAADLGGAEAAWRVVEYHLNAPAERKDTAELRHYLRRAVGLGRNVTAAEADMLAASGQITPGDVAAILGENPSAEGNRAARSLIPFLQLDINIDGKTADDDSLYLQYLEEIATLPQAPGHVFTRLADEVAVRRGRWAAETDIIALLEEAARRDDPDGKQKLAQRLIRYRDDSVQVQRAEALLLDAVDRHGAATAMNRLDALYRCQLNDAPRRDEADHWARAYADTSHRLVGISATDLIALDPYKDPETIAHIQSQAVVGRPMAIANQAQRVQSGGMPSLVALRYWADRLDNSDQALEAFAELQFELATSPAERAQAIEFFRRIYLNNGVTTALDLAVALVEDNGRDPEIAAEIVDLLTRAGNRGEGAAIRLLARLRADRIPQGAVYAEFAEVIEERGDFLALMFAIPYISEHRLDDYIDRAVSVMTCGTKDSDELGEAYALSAKPAMSYHWRQVGLAIEGGNVLSKLRLSDAQMGRFEDGRAPDAPAVAERARAEGRDTAHRRLFLLSGDPDLTSYAPQSAAAQIVAGLEADDLAWAFAAWREAGPEVREIVAGQVDLAQVFRRGADSGDARAAFAMGMILRDTARGPDDLARSARWLEVAAEAGQDDAMVELGFAMGFGLGIPRDRAAALDWLARAAQTSHPRADDLAHMIRAASP